MRLLSAFCIVAAAISAVACTRSQSAPQSFAQSPDDDADLEELSWIASDADKLAILTTSPGECLRAPESAEETYLVEVGRAAFSSPLLLGGPAARSGLSCASCHRDGHDNPAFFLAGLSGEPGTADVTSSLFSKTRGDGVFNPAPIPTLVDAAQRESFGTRAPADSLHGFIEGAVIDEFQGAPPPPAVVAGLVAYVAHLDSAACPATPVMRTSTGEMEKVIRTMQVAHAALGRDEAAEADFLVLSAQRALRPIHERYASTFLAEQRGQLSALAADLAAVRHLIRTEPALALEKLRAAQVQAETVADSLYRARSKSLYDKAVLSAALSGYGE